MATIPTATDATDPPLAEALARSREETLRLVALVEEADLNRSLDPEFSPIRWHLGHVAAFEGLWVLQNAGRRPTLDPRYDALFDPRVNPKAERVHLPPKSEILDYAARTREAVLDVLASADDGHPSPLLRGGYAGHMVHQHECQHQEIITFLLQMIPPDRKARPDNWAPAADGDEPEDALIAVPGGPFTMGSTGPWFAYDNEREPHEVDLPAFRIGRAPVTEVAFARFVEAGGYRDEALWTPEGWRWRAENRIEAPRDWRPAEAGGWTIRTMFEDRGPKRGVPVIGVSQFEAQAYARWTGGRLPTEAEWERAAAWDTAAGASRRFPWGDRLPDASLANTDGIAWGTRSVSGDGRGPAGLDDAVGQVWEWTASDFAPYPGFTPFPYADYSQAWFDGEHRVLRGGSWATRGPLCRATFRNWYHPFVRAIFAGFRLAADSR